MPQVFDNMRGINILHGLNFEIDVVRVMISELNDLVNNVLGAIGSDANSR